MKIARIENNVVVEIIPEYALPVEKWYGTQFASLCKEVPDNVEPNYIYNPETDSYQPPVIKDPPAPDPTWNEDVDAMLVDHELRLSMVELGLDPKDESEVKK
jgi:hypothetical protein